ncbi:hypothetical protein PROFUN_00201 [Planoprotostelium fungivorum]|uniref:Folylpolyglutamate synthase n=1 Tax=Planoprotostelium fungivorum TaxID=1890364 RepID=A0A2P6P0Z8_9EUKA|nr:hypothetical protein PROFUN_00201 [Planoprotostelium fungivorum]
MPESYADCLRALNSLQSNSDAIKAWIDTRRIDLEATLAKGMVTYVNRLNIDLSKMSIIHVAGTKGKGSTCAFTESIIRKNGYKTGLFTSPHLVSVRERIRINGEPVSQEDFARYFWKVWHELDASKTEEQPNMPGYFSFLTLLALKVFSEEQLDCVVLEVGIGGRTDATNVVPFPLVTGVTSLGFDHQNVLGNTLLEIAFEKSGIFKRGVPAVTSPQPEDALETLKKRAVELIREEPFKQLHVIDSSPLLEEIDLGLPGKHQKYNASMALALSKIWMKRTKGEDLQWREFQLERGDLTPQTLEGLATVDWPGRGQKIRVSEDIMLYMDGAHTGESMQACVEWFFDVEVKDKEGINVLVFNCGNTRSPTTLLQPIIDYHLTHPHQKRFDHGIVSTNESCKQHVLFKLYNPNQASWYDTIAEEWRRVKGDLLPEPTVTPDIPTTVARLRDISEKNPGKKVRVLVAGSLYLVGGFLEVVKNHCPDDLSQ